MEDLNNLLDFPSPSNSQYYMYGDADQHLDSNTSESQSPVNSPVSSIQYAPFCFTPVNIANTNLEKYDMSYMPDLSNISSVYPSPERDDEEEENSKTSKPAAKRKRENRYKNAPPAVLSVSSFPPPYTLIQEQPANPFQRRRAQNRASQRAYRERKDQRIKDLETMLNDAKQRNDVLSQAYATLHAEYVQLRTSKRKEHHLDGLPQSAYGGAELVFDPTMGAVTGAGGDRLDMDLYVYSDLTGGANAFSM
jgi:AP-1-like factor